MSSPDPQNADPLGDDDVAEANDAPAQAFHEAMSQLGELKQYVAQYVSARIDLARLSLRRKLVALAAGMLALLAGAAAIVTLVVLLLDGLSRMIAAGLGGRLWAGDLIVGGGLLLVLAGAGWIGIYSLFSARREATVQRYERRQAQQRARVGHDARERGAEYASKAAHGS